MKKIKLPSGAVLEVGAADFQKSRNLFKAATGQIKGVDLKQDVKDMFLGMLASDEVEQAVHDCFSRCLYNGEKLSIEVFEEEKAREDYITTLVEVSMVNLSPFLKSLYVEFEKAIQLATISQA
tara:strand:- start:24156 stop:24524 length:369 start_codon:yes stop_codon:yes gene_type:complete